MNRSLERKDDYKFSTAKDPLFNSNGFCKVEDHCRQEHRCDCVCTDRSLSMLEQRLKRAVQKGLPGLFSSRKTEMSVKGTECSELCGVVYFKPSVLNHTQENKGLVYIQCMLAKKEDACTRHSWLNYKVITPNRKHAPPDARRPKKFQKEAAQQESPCKPLPFHILPMNLYMSWVVSI